MNKNTQTVIKSGTIYKLTKDILNPRPDKRNNSDWRLAKEWEAGRLFKAMSSRINDNKSVITLMSGYFTHQHVMPNSEVYQLIEPHLVPIISDFTQDGIEIQFLEDTITFQDDATKEDGLFFAKVRLSDWQSPTFKKRIALAVVRAIKDEASAIAQEAR